MANDDKIKLYGELYPQTEEQIVVDMQYVRGGADVVTKTDVSSEGNTADWDSSVTVGTIKGKDLTFKMPSNPNTHYTKSLKIKAESTEVIDFNQSEDKTVTFKGGNNVSLSSSGTEITIAATDTNTHYTNYLEIKGNNTSAVKFTQDSDKTLNIASGDNISIAASDGTITINNTYSYTLPQAADGTLGGIKLGYNQTGDNYPVQLSDGKAFVTVPGVTPYTAGTNLGLSNHEFSLDSNISLTSVTANSFISNSDKRLKENIEDFKYEKSILDLPVKTFNFKNSEENQIGCLAQDLQKLYPQLVIENENGYLSIQENKLVYLLLEEIKRLNTRISELENKVINLK